VGYELDDTIIRIFNQSGEMAVQLYAPTVIKEIDVLLFFFYKKVIPIPSMVCRRALSLINWKNVGEN
jgi:hypothetical protein